MAERRPRVLVIDDEPHVCELWAEFVRACGYDVEVATNGPDGLARLHAGRYDVVVTDFLMPGMNGRVVARAVRHPGADVGVILITGSIEESDTELLSEPGVTVLRKPIDFADFRAALRDCLARPVEQPVAISSPA